MIRRIIFPLVAVAFLAAVAAGADDSSRLDWSAWRQMPVFGRGRAMPLDTVARSTVEGICGRVSPKLSLAGSQPQNDPGAAAPAEARTLFPGGQPRKFSAAELLFSWLVEPERWQRVPFLLAGYEPLRTELLDLPVTDELGGRLKHASPRQVENARRFRLRLGEIADEQRGADSDGERFRPSKLDRKAGELANAYDRFGSMTFNPDAPVAMQGRLADKLAAAIHVFSQLQGNLQQWQRFRGGKDPDDLIDRTEKAAEGLRDLLMQGGELSGAELEPLLAEMSRSSKALAGSFARLSRQPAEPLPEASRPNERGRREFARWTGVLADATGELADCAVAAHMALYDNGHSLRLVPALNRASLEADRDPGEDVQPWLSFEAVIYGSQELLEGYPRLQIQKVRQAFKQAAAAYVDRKDPDRPQKFAAAMDRFAAEVRTLGEQIEPLRRELPIRKKDEELIKATAYPPPGATDVEVRYNSSNPFLWSWIVSLLATTCFGFSFAVVRKTMFWLGIAVLTAAQVLIIYGFALRVYITGWAPVTNMFETVVFVALVVAMLGVWFTLLPLAWPGLSIGWRATALPWRWAAELSPRWRPFAWPLFLLRLALVAGVFYALAMVDYDSAEHLRVISLLPKTAVGSSLPTFNAALTWAAGMCVLAVSMWFVPRAILTAVLAPATVPRTLAKSGISEPLGQVYSRKLFAVVGATVAFLASILAYYSPIFHDDIRPLMPVLRNNFWLTLHVLSITASYGAGALAWGLGNISLGYYLFGRYRDPLVAGALRRRPAEPCATLAGFIYKSIQVAVLLLAAGTILGALWADVSWGRFWSWDPKEVWALISLLAFMVILHGRYVRWFGDFGMAVASVLGATAIVWAWYGVNYLMPGGLHTYGSGTGGQAQVLTVMALNWLFVAAAAIRYNIAVRKGAISGVRT